VQHKEQGNQVHADWVSLCINESCHRFSRTCYGSVRG